MCVRVAVQDERCLGESDSSEMYFSFLVEGFVPLVRDYFSEILFSVILYQSFQFFQYEPGNFIVFSRSTSSRAALGEGGVTYTH